MDEPVPFRLTDRAREIRELARQLLIQFGLPDWEFGINNNVRRAGVCYYLRGAGAGRIEISGHFAERNSHEEVLDTILHEIAHALVGPHHGHDAVWRAKCREIGARPQRCYGQTVEMPKGSWRAVCPSCEVEYDRHRRPAAGQRWHCRTCGPTRGELKWRKVGSADPDRR